MPRVTVVLCIALAVMAGRPAPAAEPAAEDAAAVVARLHSALVELAGREPAPGPGERVEILAPVVRESHDLSTMARITVRRFWRAWSEAERQAFLAAFERLSVATYASRFANVGPDTFSIIDSELDDDRAEVRARIRRADGGDDVSLDYTLAQDGERWRIVNILADGASELGIMGSRYFEILDGGDLEDLIAHIEDEIAQL